MHHGQPRLRFGLLAAIGLLLLAGCNSGKSTPTTTPAPPTTPRAATATASPAAKVTADLTDFAITLSQRSLPPGTYTFVAEQRGQSPHALAIVGPGINSQTKVIEPGGAAQELTVVLQPGTYELWCPVGNHRALGMTVTITIA